MKILFLACVVVVFVTAESDFFLERAKKLVNQHGVIDGHNDLSWRLRSESGHATCQVFGKDSLDLSVLQPHIHTDLVRLREGGVVAQWLSAFVPCSFQYKDAVRVFEEMIDCDIRLTERYNDTLHFAVTARDIEDAIAAKKIAILVGVEGGHAIDSSLASLRMMYKMGARYMTLTHQCDTPWASANNVANDTGLTEFGLEVVSEMNRLGMLVDLSHVSFNTMRDALKRTRSPVIFSHSDAYTLCNNARNVPDDVLDSVRENRGVVMINFYSSYVNCSGRATLSDVVDHIMYVANRCGVTCVGIGSDFDGVDVLPVGLEDVSKFPYLIAELLRRGVSDEDVALIMNGNLLRVMKEAEHVAKVLQQTTAPGEIQINPQFNEKLRQCRSTD